MSLPLRLRCMKNFEEDKENDYRLRIEVLDRERFFSESKWPLQFSCSLAETCFDFRVFPNGLSTHGASGPAIGPIGPAIEITTDYSRVTVTCSQLEAADEGLQYDPVFAGVCVFSVHDEDVAAVHDPDSPLLFDFCFEIEPRADADAEGYIPVCDVVLSEYSKKPIAKPSAVTVEVKYNLPRKKKKKRKLAFA